MGMFQSDIRKVEDKKEPRSDIFKNEKVANLKKPFGRKRRS
jgi:hypothetical protein